jgi:hypothetical protein
MQYQVPTLLSGPLIFDSTVDVRTTDSLLTWSSSWMVFSKLSPTIWLLLTLLGFGFGGSLMLPCGDVIFEMGTLSAVSATQQSTCQSLLPFNPHYIWENTFQLLLQNEIMVMASPLLFNFLYCVPL